jgi:hypothetical protein
MVPLKIRRERPPIVVVWHYVCVFFLDDRDQCAQAALAPKAPKAKVDKAVNT